MRLDFISGSGFDMVLCYTNLAACFQVPTELILSDDTGRNHETRTTADTFLEILLLQLPGIQPGRYRVYSVPHRSALQVLQDA